MNKLTVEVIRSMVAVLQKYKIPPIVCPGCGRSFYKLFDQEDEPLKECWQHETQEIALLGVRRYIEVKGN